jgi:hypothetical protein
MRYKYGPTLPLRNLSDITNHASKQGKKQKQQGYTKEDLEFLVSAFTLIGWTLKAFGILCILLVILMLTGCTAKYSGVHHYSAKQKDYLIDRYWLDAQQELEDKTCGQSMLVPRDIVHEWVWSNSLLTCPVMKDGKVIKSEVLAFGCYERDGYTKKVTIKTVSWRPWTIKHEACHAILHYLQAKDWDTYCHIPGKGFR